MISHHACDVECAANSLHPSAADGVVHVTLLKQNRRGHYADGCTAADTFWHSLLDQRGHCADVNRLPDGVPTAYYSSPYEDE